MPMFTRKPLAVEAREVTRESFYEVAEWCGATSVWGLNAPDPAIFIEDPHLEVQRAFLGHWVVKHECGEFEFMRPTAFHAEYEDPRDNRWTVNTFHVGALDPKKLGDLIRESQERSRLFRLGGRRK